MPRFELVVAAMPDRDGVNPFARQPIRILGRPGRHEVFEIEVYGKRVETITIVAGFPRWAVSEYPDPGAASAAAAKTIAKKERQKFARTGPSRMLRPRSVAVGGSLLLLEERFAAGDPGFLADLLALSAEKPLAALATRWLADTRAPMRRALLEYIDDGCDRPGHRGLVKRLFKGAEERADDELMAHFMVAFDRLGIRIEVERDEWIDRERVRRKHLVPDPGIPGRASQWRPERFSRATRAYLARRAFRYFRKLGKKDLARYVRATDLALELYPEAAFVDAADFLDAWGLVHTLHGWAKSLLRKPRGLRLKAGKSLAKLKVAPYFPDAFAGRRDELLALLARARSRAVRGWLVRLLARDYADELAGIPILTLRPLLASPYEDAVAFGAARLVDATGLETLSVPDWLSLLRIEDVDVAPAVVEAFRKHVAPKRLDLGQCVGLTAARIAEVAALGLEWAKSRGVARDEELALVARASASPVEKVRREATAWVLELGERFPAKLTEHLRDLLDSKHSDVRALAAEWTAAHPDASTVPLWIALAETPYADVRELVLANARRWQADAGAGELAELAGGVLLSIHRGAAIKPQMVRRLVERAVAHPAEAERLLPLVVTTLRSIRAPERTSALGALARAALADETIRALLTRITPELTVAHEVAR